MSFCYEILSNLWSSQRSFMIWCQHNEIMKSTYYTHMLGVWKVYGLLFCFEKKCWNPSDCWVWKRKCLLHLKKLNGLKNLENSSDSFLLFIWLLKQNLQMGWQLCQTLVSFPSIRCLVKLFQPSWDLFYKREFKSLRWTTVLCMQSFTEWLIWMNMEIFRREGWKNLACVNGKEPGSPLMLTHSKWEEHMHMDFLKKNTNTFLSPLNDVIVLLNCKTVSVVVCIRNSVTYDTLFDKWKLFQWRGEKPRDRERYCNWKSKQGPYIFLSKHLRCLASGVDSSIEPDHLRSNSLLHWRKTGHFYCQEKKKKSEGESKRGGRGENEREASARAKRRWRRDSS